MAAIFLFVAMAGASTVRYADLSERVRALLGIEAAGFPAFIAAEERNTAEREKAGERDHLIFYVLQSRRFTSAAPVEPAISAREYRLSGTIPPDALRRLAEFAKARAGNDERMAYFAGLLPRQDAMGFLKAEYARSMGSLYGKEWEHDPRFYEKRGHSTDTDVAASYAVWNALAALKQMRPDVALDRVLVVGPGLDFAPRTGLDESHAPQSYQPFAVADALLELGLSRAPAIHCVDINDRVLRFFEDFPRRRPPVLVLSSTPGDAEYVAYFERLGRYIGTVRKVRPLLREVTVNARVAKAITAGKLNVVTERLAEPFDLAIATNVLLYFGPEELTLAFANMHAMLKPGGYVIHNDLRQAADVAALANGFAPIHARTIRVARGANAPLFDSFAIYRR